MPVPKAAPGPVPRSAGAFWSEVGKDAVVEERQKQGRRPQNKEIEMLDLVFYPHGRCRGRGVGLVCDPWCTGRIRHWKKHCGEWRKQAGWGA
eukprot:gene9666-biopygen10758